MSRLPRSWRWVAAVGLAATAILLSIVPVLAQTDPQTGGEVVIDQDTTDDFYFAGESLTVNATIDGDLIAFSQNLTINGTVTGDVLFMGQSLVINGVVEDDLRGAGMVIKVAQAGSIGDDVNFAGYAFEMEPGARVGGKFYGGGGMITLADVAQDVALGAGSLRVIGTVGGNVDAGVSVEGMGGFDPAMFSSGQADIPSYTRIPAGLTFGDAGQIKGNLDYTTTEEIRIPSGAVAGKVTFTKEVTESQGTARVNPAAQFGNAMRGTVGRTAVMFVLLAAIGLLLQRFAPNFISNAIMAMRTRVGASIGYGLLGYAIFFGLLVGLFVVFLLLIVPLGIIGGGWPFAGLVALLGGGSMLSFAAMTGWIAPLLAALLVGEFIYALFDKEQESPIWSLLIGLVVVLAALAVPLMGGLVAFAVGVYGLGAALAVRFPAKPAAAPVVAPVVADVAQEPAKPARKRATRKQA